MEQRKLTPGEVELEETVRKAMGDSAPFKPFLMYRSDLDGVVARIRDCSTTQESYGNLLHLYIDNYPEEGSVAQYVGFDIPMARKFAEHYGLDAQTPSVAEMLNCLHEDFPDIRQEVQTARAILALLPTVTVEFS